MFYCRRNRGDSIVLYYVVRNGQTGQTVGTVRDHAAGWARLRVLHVRARRYYFADLCLILKRL